MAPSECLYHFRVKVPTFQQGKVASYIWSLGSAFGITEDDAFAEMVQRFPDAVEVQPKAWVKVITKDTTRLPAEDEDILCISMDVRDVSHWCRYCGQGAEQHPVRKSTPVGKVALAWIQQRTADYHSGIYWD